MPLIVKNRVIGVIDLQSEQVGYFQPEHRRLLELTASRVAQAIESHHEAFDGSGYPFGLKGEDIPLHGRIVAVCDAYVNMTSDRTFAPPKTDEQAMAELAKLSGTRFDGMIVRLFARLLKMERASSLGGAT